MDGAQTGWETTCDSGDVVFEGVQRVSWTDRGTVEAVLRETEVLG